MEDMRVWVMMSILRALWGQVTSDLRGVAVSFAGSPDNGEVKARFLYEGEVGDLQSDCVSEAETYCMADFPTEVSVDFRPVPDADRELLPDEQWVFLRWEPES